jgi:hypothetical protein
MKCSGLHCSGCGHRGGNAGVGAGAVIALIVLAVVAANRRAIGHAASVAVHVLEIAAEIAAGLAAAVAVTAAVLVIRRRAMRRAVAALSAVQTYREIPQAHIRALPQATSRPAHLADCDCLRCLTRRGPRPTTESFGPPAALVPAQPKWPHAPGWTSRNEA